MKKYFIVSDVHSYYEVLMKELNKKKFDINNDEHILIVAGDLFDRGNESVPLYYFVKDLQSKNRFIYVRGNHEDLLFYCVKELKENCGRASTQHYSNGTINTIQHFMEENILEEVLAFINANALDYYELSNYIIVHGWLPTFGNWKEQDSKAWEAARWINGLKAWEENKFPVDKTIICGHWHTVEFNKKYHNLGSGIFDNKANFSAFIDKGIIALDASTVFSQKINVVVINEKGKLLKK